MRSFANFLNAKNLIFVKEKQPKINSSCSTEREHGTHVMESSKSVHGSIWSREEVLSLIIIVRGEKIHQQRVRNNDLPP